MTMNIKRTISALNECHRQNDLDNDDIPGSNEIVGMIHENPKFVYTIHSLRRNFDAHFINRIAIICQHQIRNV